MTYSLLAVKSGETLATFATPQEAVAAQAAYTEKTRIVKGVGRAPAPHEPTWWAREQARLDSGEYTRLPEPWGTLESEATLRHYAHVSKKGGAKVAFTATALQGEQDRQMILSAERYLQTYFPSTPPALFLAALGVGVAEFKIVSDPEDIAEIYESAKKVRGDGTGGTSCMAGRFDTRCHPAYVYGAGDLALAYLEDVESEEIVARCLIWPEKKIYGRAYGVDLKTHDDLIARLLSQGYGHGKFAGVRLLVESEGNGFLMPFLDGIQGVSRNGGYWIISRHGEREASGSDGIIETGERCMSCGAYIPEGESYSNPVGDTICEDCYHDQYTSCSHCRETTPQGGATWIEAADDDVCPDCLEQHYSKCPECDTYFRSDDSPGVNSDGEALCPACAESRIAMGDDDETVYLTRQEFIDRQDEELAACRDDTRQLPLTGFVGLPWPVAPIPITACQSPLILGGA